MRIEPLGDRAAVLRDLPAPPYQLVNSAEKLPGVAEAVASYETLGVYFEGGLAMQDLEVWLEANMAKLMPSVDPPRHHSGPVCYELGVDLAEAAAQLKISEAELIAAHLSRQYRCYAVGFVPGFPYLGYLPEVISGLPRKDQPRISVEVGAVGIVGKQTGIYPSAVPGGWNLIGRTPLEIVGVADNYFPIGAGDEIQFTRIDRREFERLKGERL